VVLLLVGLALLVLHMVMDASATMLVVTPLLAPTLVAMNVSLLHFGVLLDVTSAAGLIIPPLGFNLYIASQISGVAVEKAARAAIPYVLVTVAVAVLIACVPSLSTYLPSLFQG
jgi:C4-dicarboxylate transporter DctM subunit